MSFWRYNLSDDNDDNNDEDKENRRRRRRRRKGRWLGLVPSWSHTQVSEMCPVSIGPICPNCFVWLFFFRTVQCQNFHPIVLIQRKRSYNPTNSRVRTGPSAPPLPVEVVWELFLPDHLPRSFPWSQLMWWFCHWEKMRACVCVCRGGSIWRGWTKPNWFSATCWWFLREKHKPPKASAALPSPQIQTDGNFGGICLFRNILWIVQYMSKTFACV